MSWTWKRHCVTLVVLGQHAVSIASGQTPTDTTERSPAPKLPPIVVTATRVAFPAVTAGATVITRAELREQGVYHLPDALRSVPGLSVVQTGSFGGLTSLYPRGGESGYTRVLINGVPVNDAGGEFDFATLTTEDIDRIEVVRGPASVLYGTDAVSAVIQVFTRSGSSAPEVSVAATAGNYAVAAVDASVAGGTPSVSYGFHAGRFRTNGIYEFNNDYEHSLVSGIVRLAPTARSRGQFFVRYADDRVHIPTDGSGNVVDRNAFQFAQRLTAGLELARLIGERTEVQLNAAAHITDGGFDDKTDEAGDTLGFFAFRSLDHSARRSVDGRVNLRPTARTVLTVGGLVEQQSEQSFSESLSEFGPSYGTFDVRRATRAAYTQGIGITGPLTWNLGGRVDDSEAFGRFGTYRGGLAVTGPAGVRLRAAAGTAFREPSLFQNYATGFARGNPNLRPERTRSWEVGADCQLTPARLTASATWFDQRFSDLIEFTFTTPSPDDPNFFNVASASARGIESELRWEPSAGLHLAGGYTYVSAVTRQPGFDIGGTGYFRPGDKLLRRPVHSGSTTLGYRSERGSIVGHALYVGARQDIDFARGQRVTLAGYTTVDVSTWILVRRAVAAGAAARLSVFAKVANALDRRYAGVYGYRAPGRTIQAGMRAEF
jgi:vitamin B12 transporter